MAEEAHLSEHLGSAKRSRRCWLIHLGHFSVTHRAAYTRTHHHHRHCVSQPARTWTTPRRLHHVQLAVVRRDEGTSVQYCTVLYSATTRLFDQRQECTGFVNPYCNIPSPRFRLGDSARKCNADQMHARTRINQHTRPHKRPMVATSLYETTTDSLSDHSDHTTSTHHTTPQSTHLKSVYGYESAASKPYGNISRGPPLLCSDSNRNSLSQSDFKKMNRCEKMNR